MINTTRVLHNIETLKTFTDPMLPYTRRAFSEEYLRGRQWLMQELQQLGLSPTIDNAGNLRASLQGKTDETLYFGSHSDTVPAGGTLDGILGVAAGLEVLRYFVEQNITPHKTLEFIDFIAEETTDWGLSCIGSRALTGHLQASDLELLHPQTQERLSDAITRMGGNPSQGLPQLTSSDKNAFIELHIEQGPVLEHEQIEIGIVTHIVGITRLKITFNGTSNHSGTTPMNLRQDALTMAAHAIIHTQHIATKIAKNADDRQHYFVATAGHIQNFPNAINVVPGKAELIIDIRTTDHTFTEQFLEQLTQNLAPFKAHYAVQILSQTAPVPLDAELVQLCQTIAQDQQISTLKMTSGAGHDAAFMASIAKAVMIFIPSIAGISHNPQEKSSDHHIIVGCKVFFLLIFKLALSDNSR